MYYIPFIIIKNNCFTMFFFIIVCDSFNVVITNNGYGFELLKNCMAHKTNKLNMLLKCILKGFCVTVCLWNIFAVEFNIMDDLCLDLLIVFTIQATWTTFETEKWIHHSYTINKDKDCPSWNFRLFQNKKFRITHRDKNAIMTMYVTFFQITINIKDLHLLN